VTPANRKGHSAVIFGSFMYVYGGYIDIRGSTKEFWKFDFGECYYIFMLFGMQVSLKIE